MVAGGCGINCLKWALFAVNFVVWLLGVAIVVIGSLILASDDFKQVWNKLDGYTFYQSAAVLVLIAGAIILLVGFLGCCGAFMENRCMLVTFAIIVGLIVILELTAMGLVWKKASKETLQEELSKTFRDIIQDQGGNIKERDELLQYVQTTFNCCGGYNQFDYRSSYPNSNDMNAKKPLPPSCFALENTNGYVHTKGCGQAVTEFLFDHALQVGLVSLGIVLLEVASLAIGILLSCKIGDSKGVV